MVMLLLKHTDDIDYFFIQIEFNYRMSSKLNMDLYTFITYSAWNF